MNVLPFRDAFQPYLYTVVTLENGGQARFDRCVADVEDGKLLITSTEDESTVALLDGWRDAVVFDHNNQIQYAHEAISERKSA